MRQSMMLAVFCGLAFPTIALANGAHPKVATPTDVRNNPPQLVVPARGLVLRQDLFDRNNPNNLRSNWPVPPAQPGQF
jgi:hypothetical protein